MKNADLLLIEPKKDEFSNLIANSTSIKHNYSHVALVYVNDEEAFVIHAIPNRGVVKQRMSQFLDDRNDQNIDLYRVTKDIDRDEVIGRAKAMLGKPYNNLFLNQHASFYCSQLVTHAYEKEGVFELTPLRFGQGKQIDEEWVNYYQEYEMTVPTDEMGSSPNSLVESKMIKLVEHVQ
ncbi:YiiX/YebB-like N1pC/P60 family cysteine hydrolase [Apilactobacillus kunkeei]|uniref:Permuted papain-like amidase enzyme, YaeF/YiiX, C92 family n=1 Tax=Apilactobacillus kunkeei TaxID=148814 RepID=A0A0P7JPY8_9LACO|nr:YiiX/YebB-like N1pC/P60 family cysteine hydrolase [Apilactobacillus kunkeei]KPN83465.1 hypothetical protein RZ78_09330 [Apilactobacillus kunkeei]